MRFIRPQSLGEALKWGKLSGSHYLAGGTDLVLKMRRGETKPERLVDLALVEELREIRMEESLLTIGSMVTFGEIERNPLIQTHAQALWQACLTMGSPQIRNQATLGGNLGNCSPAADSLPPLLALGATVVLCSLKQNDQGQLGDEVQVERVLLSELLKREPLLEQGTLIRCFQIPLKGSISVFAKLGRREALAIARLSVAVSLQMDGANVREVQVALGAVGKRAFLSETLSSNLKNRPFNEEWLEAAVEQVQTEVGAALGNRASAPYKRVAVGGVMREALRKVTI